MRKLSYRALRVYQEAYKKVSEALITAQRLKGNTVLIKMAVEQIIKLNIHELMGVNREHIVEALDVLERIREKVSKDPVEYFSAEECEAVLDLFVVCLEAEIIPDSCLVIGTIEDQKAEYQRLTELLKEKNMIEEG